MNDLCAISVDMCMLRPDENAAAMVFSGVEISRLGLGLRTPPFRWLERHRV